MSYTHALRLSNVAQAAEQARSRAELARLAKHVTETETVRVEQDRDPRPLDFSGDYFDFWNEED